MDSLRFMKIGALLLASAVFCYGQHGRPAGVGGGHMGGGMASGAGSSMGNPGMSDHGPQSRPTQQQPRTPQELLDQNTRLTSNLQGLLPQGTTPQQACSGFSNLGQCVAAIHVSHNLGISFDDLKNKMTGTGSEKLGKAIHDLKPDANAKAESKKAQKQAKADLKASRS